MAFFMTTGILSAGAFVSVLMYLASSAQCGPRPFTDGAQLEPFESPLSRMNGGDDKGEPGGPFTSIQRLFTAPHKALGMKMNDVAGVKGHL